MINQRLPLGLREAMALPVLTPKGRPRRDDLQLICRTKTKLIYLGPSWEGLCLRHCGRQSHILFPPHCPLRRPIRRPIKSTQIGYLIKESYIQLGQIEFCGLSQRR